MGSYRRKTMGLGRTPLKKVETNPAGVVLTPNTRPTAPVLTTPTYTPPANNWWSGVNTYLPQILDFAKPFVHNASNRNQGHATPPYAPPTQQPQQQRPVVSNQNSTVAGSSRKGLGDFIMENPIAVGFGVLGIGFLAFKALK